MCVGVPAEVFIPDFEHVGFALDKLGVLFRYSGRWEKLLQWRDWHRLPPRCVLLAGKVLSALRYWFDNPRRADAGYCDYVFVWYKPKG
jgi:hypothetical protein